MAPSVQVSRIRSLVAAQPPSVQVSRIRSTAGASGSGGPTVQVSRIRSTIGGTVTPLTGVEPFSTVNLGSGTWTQTGGTTVTPPSFPAPALPNGDTLTFVDGTGATKVVTVLPHTIFFRQGSGNALVGLDTNVAGGTRPPSTTMPAAPPAGPWARQYGQDFSVDVAEGGFNFNSSGNITAASAAYASYGNNAVGGQLNGYHDGNPDTSGSAQYYSSKTMSVANSVLSIRLHTEVVNSVSIPMGGHIHPVVPAAFKDPADGWKTLPYGRWSYRVRSDVTPGFGGVGLLIGKPWPADGEFDFPEILTSASSAITGVYHYADAAGGQDGPKTFTGLRTDWHVYTIEWIPGRVTWLIDDVQVYTSTDRVPAHSMYFHIQVGSTGSVPPDTSAGLYQIDWITYDSYTG